jgi:hypothetical protein
MQSGHQETTGEADQPLAEIASSRIMSDDTEQTKDKPPEFDFSAYPSDSLFHDRRTGIDRRESSHLSDAGKTESPAGAERRAKKERRKRIDPTTFEKQYTEDEIEFMTAVQRFKEHSRKQFPTYGEVLRIAVALGYRRVVIDDDYPVGPVQRAEEVNQSHQEGNREVIPPNPHLSPHLC